MTTRTPIGNYNKYVGYALAWILRRYAPKGTQVLLRGRGKRVKTNWWGERVRLGDRYSIPLKHATRVGIYIVQTIPGAVGYAYPAPVVRVSRQEECPDECGRGGDPERFAQITRTWDETNNLETCERG